jgi:hypothetical protein
MALKAIYRCECGAERKETNHWFAAVPNHMGSVTFYLWERARALELLDMPGTVHLCGQRCADRLNDLFMSGKL